mgnify:CR=1 FL=1
MSLARSSAARASPAIAAAGELDDANRRLDAGWLSIRSRLAEAYTEGASLNEALAVAVGALAGPDRVLTEPELEVAILDRNVDWILECNRLKLAPFAY